MKTFFYFLAQRVCAQKLSVLIPLCFNASCNSQFSYLSYFSRNFIQGKDMETLVDLAFLDVFKPYFRLSSQFLAASLSCYVCCIAGGAKLCFASVYFFLFTALLQFFITSQVPRLLHFFLIIRI